MNKDKEKTKEKLLKAIKKAKKHRERALKQTAKEWKREGIEGEVVLVQTENLDFRMEFEYRATKTQRADRFLCVFVAYFFD